jgi:hypothetical protein
VLFRLDSCLELTFWVVVIIQTATWAAALKMSTLRP